jgi:hypothetical protein
LAAVEGDKTLAELAEQFCVHPTQITEWKLQLLTFVVWNRASRGTKPHSALVAAEALGPGTERSAQSVAHPFILAHFLWKYDRRGNEAGSERAHNTGKYMALPEAHRPAPRWRLLFEAAGRSKFRRQESLWKSSPVM